MVNGLTLWGNRRLLPRGPLRESLNALQRADIVVLHHADLVYLANLRLSFPLSFMSVMYTSF